MNISTGNTENPLLSSLPMEPGTPLMIIKPWCLKEAIFRFGLTKFILRYDCGVGWDANIFLSPLMKTVTLDR